MLNCHRKDFLGKRFRYGFDHEGLLWISCDDVCDILNKKTSKVFAKISNKKMKKIKINDHVCKLLCCTINDLSKVLCEMNVDIDSFITFLCNTFDLCDDDLFEVNKRRHLVIIYNSYKFELKQEYEVGDYTIDLYFPQQNIAVDCSLDESEDYDEVKKREEYLYNKLKCKFIRFHPYSDYFCIGFVIKEINDLIYG